MDLSKAFDTVFHVNLANKLEQLDMSDSIYSWLVDYFLGMQHATKFAGQLSGKAATVAIVEQGSGVGPSECDAIVYTYSTCIRYNIATSSQSSQTSPT